MEDHSNEKSPMERFEDLLSRIFQAGKKEVTKDVQEVEESVEEAFEPKERLELDE